MTSQPDRAARLVRLGVPPSLPHVRAIPTTRIEHHLPTLSDAHIEIAEAVIAEHGVSLLDLYRVKWSIKRFYSCRAEIVMRLRAAGAKVDGIAWFLRLNESTVHRIERRETKKTSRERKALARAEAVL